MLTITSNKINTSSGKLILEEGDHQIELRSSKTIVTDKFISVGTYVFPRGNVIPLAYFTVKKTGGTSTVFTYDVSTGTLTKKDSNGTGELIKVPYANSGITSILNDSSIEKSYFLSACQSQVASNSSVEANELAYYKSNQAFNKNYYSLSIAAPSVLFSSESIPLTGRADLTATQSGNVITFTSTVPAYLYIVLAVTL